LGSDIATINNVTWIEEDKEPAVILILNLSDMKNRKGRIA